MTPDQILALANAAASVLSALLPRVSELLHRGEITVAQQNELLAQIASIRGGFGFEGPGWQLDPPAPHVPPGPGGTFAAHD